MQKKQVTNAAQAAKLYAETNAKAKEFHASFNDQTHAVKTSDRRAVVFFFAPNAPKGAAPVWAEVINGTRAEVAAAFYAYTFATWEAATQIHNAPKDAPTREALRRDFPEVAARIDEYEIAVQNGDARRADAARVAMNMQNTPEDEARAAEAKTRAEWTRANEIGTAQRAEVAAEHVTHSTDTEAAHLARHFAKHGATIRDKDAAEIAAYIETMPATERAQIEAEAVEEIKGQTPDQIRAIIRYEREGIAEGLALYPFDMIAESTARRFLSIPVYEKALNTPPAPASPEVAEDEPTAAQLQEAADDLSTRAREAEDNAQTCRDAAAAANHRRDGFERSRQDERAKYWQTVAEQLNAEAETAQEIADRAAETVEDAQAHDQNSAAELTAAEVEAAREWLADCDFSHTEEMTPRQIEAALRRHYEGGTQAFKTANAPTYRPNAVETVPTPYKAPNGEANSPERGEVADPTNPNGVAIGDRVLSEYTDPTTGAVETIGGIVADLQKSPLTGKTRARVVDYPHEVADLDAGAGWNAEDLRREEDEPARTVEDDETAADFIARAEGHEAAAADARQIAEGAADSLSRNKWEHIAEENDLWAQHARETAAQMLETAPAAVIFDTITAAQIKAGDVLIIGSNARQITITEAQGARFDYYQFKTAKGVLNLAAAATVQRIKPAALAAVALSAAQLSHLIGAVEDLREFAKQGAAECLETRKNLDAKAHQIADLLKALR